MNDTATMTSAREQCVAIQGAEIKTTVSAKLESTGILTQFLREVMCVTQ